MFSKIADKHQRKIALFCFFVFYLDFAMPMLAKAIGRADSQRYFSQNLTTRKVGLPAIASRQLGRVFPVAVSNVIAEEPSTSQKHLDRPEKIDIGGPGQPEMSSFKSVNANDMVDLFSGDFSYNIPLMDVGGYPINIHYSSNVSMDQEASWVGFGWNLNPGTVSRSMRGLPDDFNGQDTISKTQSIKEDRTIGVNVGGDVEFKGVPVKLGGSLGIFHNTYRGWGTETSINASLNSGSQSYGPLTAGLSLGNNSQTGLNVSPSLGFRLGLGEKGESGNVTMGMSTNYNSRSGLSSLTLNASVRHEKLMTSNQYINNEINGLLSPSGTMSFATPTYVPGISMPYTSTQYKFTAKLGKEFTIVHPSLHIEGYVNKQKINDEDKRQAVPAVGYLYMTNSTDRPNVLQDFNREKDIAINPKTTPHVAIPQYTYDVYSISGEGIGGMFRPYRGDVGYVRDYNMRTKSKSDKFSIDLGFGNLFHGGIDFTFTTSTTEQGAWIGGNNMNPHLRFRKNDTSYQAVYFRNPGEKTSNTKDYYNAIGDDEVMRVRLDGSDQATAANAFLTFKNGKQTNQKVVNAPLVKRQRDKKSQVINHFTAREAMILGLEKTIKSYKENSKPTGGCNDSIEIIKRVDGQVRRGHHLSQINVLNGDGRRYVYGIPAYNIMQKDVSFSVNPEQGNVLDHDKGLVSYGGADNTKGNIKGKESLFNQDSMPAYAHSFLLSGILSTDYVDVRGDGISEDDIGDAIKFNYTRVYGGENNSFDWRTPHDYAKANHNEGLKTYKRDDKASLIYGKKEVWYQHSIESKTMVALFKTSADRKDIYSIADENGGYNLSKPLRKLTRIELYTKADLSKNGDNARPVKTVNFSYSYRLCKKYASSDSGKLTLDSIWFTYNGNYKGRKNPYVFKYHDGDATLNPDYHSKKYDRWGNYKDPQFNPGGLLNHDYPYAEQDSARAAKYAAAWTLNQIQLPSGGKIKVTYESDDYAFVQNKRATNFYTISGISNSSSVANGTELYQQNLTQSSDNYYVSVNSPVALLTKAEILHKFLEGNQYIYFKLSVKVPTDKWGAGNEFIPVYAEVEDYGLHAGGNKFWLKLKPVENESPLARSALQFLRLNLPSKAYPNSEPGDQIGVWDAVKMLATAFTEIGNAVKGFGSQARAKGYCKIVDVNRSFVRLNKADYKKIGGGHRVKKVEIFDNWNKMTGGKESVYGQRYSYRKVEKINGKSIEISSGVASYEPMIGGEENPFRQPIPYAEKLAPMAPMNSMFSEQPLGESYFPSASIGYSKVRVRTINAKTKSANGWQETEFFTSHDFPTIVENTILDHTSKKSYNPKLRSLLRINTINHLTVSQGFKIELNDMTGKVKSQSNFAETDSINAISYVRNYYKVDNDSALQKHLNNSVWVVDSINGAIDKNGILGKDVEVMQDMRQHLSMSVANNKAFDLDLFILGIFPIPLKSLLPLPQKEETRFRSAVTVKIIQRYGILDSVVAMDKGSLVSTKNLLYDGETGEVVLSRTNNEFNDPVYNFSYPAHWAYSGMGMAYKNIDAVFENLNLIRGKLYYGNTTTEFPTERFFESGDEVFVQGTTGIIGSGSNCLSVLPFVNLFNIPLQSPLITTAWAIESYKAQEKEKGLFFIDAEGKYLNALSAGLRIVRSGKRNMLNASAGNIVSLSSPLRETSPGKFKIIIDSNTKVLNTSAVTYKDLWKVDNAFRSVDSCYQILMDTTVYFTNYNKQSTLLKRQSIGNNLTIQDIQIRNTAIQVASFNNIPSQCSNQVVTYKTKVLFNYNFSSLPFRSQIVAVNSATFKSALTSPTYLWKRDTIKTLCYPNFLPRFNHNWAAEPDRYRGNYTSVLKRVTTNWNGATRYENFGTTVQNQAVISPSSISGYNMQVSCTNLLQDVLVNNHPYFGFMFELQNPTPVNSNPSFLSLGYSSKGLQEPKDTLTINYKYKKDTCNTFCVKMFNDSSVNPYRWGMLGNWRTDRAFTYYHDRLQPSVTATTTDIRNHGILKSFTPFWTLSNEGLLQQPDTLKWVWNSASSLYNPKGLEIENYDPLGRYNAGLYGYNGTLPVAVAQNSKYREILFDGFEDYSYKTKPCVNCATPREFDFKKTDNNLSLTEEQSHTGRSSLKILAGAEAFVEVPVTTVGTDTAKQLMSLNIDSTAVFTTTVNGKGLGLTGSYQGTTAQQCPFYPTTPNFLSSRVDPQIDFQWNNSAPLTGMCNRWFTINWKGKIQIPVSDFYTFYAAAQSGVQILLDGLPLVTALNGVQRRSAQIFLTAGTLHTVELKLTKTNISNSFVYFKWNRSADQAIVTVPQRFLYRDGATLADTAGSVITTIKYWCLAPRNIKVTPSIRPVFSPVQNTKLLVSAWVRLDGDDCFTAPALSDVLIAKVWSGGGLSNTTLYKTGRRIEGWQRYEGVVPIPSDAYLFKVSAIAPSGRNVFVDDIRVQPFNSSMKGFVYDPVNLRLSSELDENNYASFYEYDDDGTLIRVKKETEKGIMTIKETRSGLVKN